MPTINITHSWPATLPLPYIDYSGGADVATLFSPGDAAIIKRRSRQTQTYATVSVRWKFEPDEWLEFLDFWEDNLGCGSAAFAIELRYPKISALDTWLVKMITGLEVETIDNAIFEVSTTLQLISLATVDAKAVAMEDMMEITRLLDDTSFRRELDDTSHNRLLE